MVKRGDIVRGWLTRPAMLAGWALVLWGTLLGLMVGVDALREGAPAVWSRFWPGSGASVFAWLNVIAVAVAGAAWATFATVLVLSRRNASTQTDPH